MTAYHGGKQRIGKEIANIIYKKSVEISKKRKLKIKGYCEPFCGMLGVYQHIPELFSSSRDSPGLASTIKYKANDINKSIISMWKKVQTGWKPKVRKITSEKFRLLKNNGKILAEKGFIGHVYSYRGIYFGAYFPHRMSKIEKSAKKIVKIGNKIKNVKFSSGSYEKYSKLKNYIIYCDPPYKNTPQRYYSGLDSVILNFDYQKFEDWCKKMSKNNIIFISEYTKPKNTKLIWSSRPYRSKPNSLKYNRSKEKLYFI